MFLDWEDIVYTATKQNKLVAAAIIDCGRDPLIYDYAHLKDEEEYLMPLGRDRKRVMKKEEGVKRKDKGKLVRFPGDHSNKALSNAGFPTGGGGNFPAPFSAGVFHAGNSAMGDPRNDGKVPRHAYPCCGD